MEIFSADYSQWKYLSRFFARNHVGTGIRTFKNLEIRHGGDMLRKARAKAWRAYCTVNAVLEGWEIEDWGNDESDRTRDELIDYAYEQAEEAMSVFGSADYDVLWALAYTKMAKLDPTAKADIESAIAIARQRSNEGDSFASQSLSSLLAEATDIFIYHGDIASAEASILEAKTLESGSKSMPDWFLWMDALVHFNKALLAENGSTTTGKLTPTELYEEVEKTLGSMRRVMLNPHYEFDSLRVRAAAQLKLGNDKLKQEYLDTFDWMLQRSDKAPWTAQKEDYRSRYLDSGDAGILKNAWSDIAHELFP